MIWHGLAIVAAVVVAAVPWGLPGETTFILPFVTLLLIFLFSVHPTQAIPVWVVFSAGLATDVLTAGPLGFWAFIYTLCYTFARYIGRVAPARSMVGLWAKYAGTAMLAAASGWVIASLYYVRLIDWWPIALGMAVSILLCPLFARPLRQWLSLDEFGGLAKVGLRS